MTTIARKGYKAGRCGNKLTTNCSCWGTINSDICDLDTDSDIDVYFSDISDCGGTCTGCDSELNGNTFRCSWNLVDSWVYSDAVVTVGVQCADWLTPNRISVTAATYGTDNCFSGTAIVAPLPNTVNNAYACAPIINQCGTNGFAVVDIA